MPAEPYLGAEGRTSAAGRQAAVLLDDDGRLMRVAPQDPALIGKPIADAYPHLKAAVAGQPAVSPVVMSAARQEPIVAFAVPFDSPTGRRVFSSGYPVAETPLAAYGKRAVTLEGGRIYLVDNRDQVMLTNDGSHASWGRGTVVNMKREPSPRPVAPLVRDRRDAVLSARRRPMAQRLELALAWDELAAELRSGLQRAQARGR